MKIQSFHIVRITDSMLTMHLNLANLIIFALCLSAAPAGASDQYVPDLGRQIAAELAASESDQEAIAFLQTSMRLSEKHETEAQVSVETQAATTTTTSVLTATGVTANSSDDLATFISAMESNGVLIIICIGFFMIAKKLMPNIYANNTLNGVQPYLVPAGMFGWAKAALGISTLEIQNTVGLDQAMLLEFAQMNMKILAAIALPIVCIFGPINCLFGGYSAGTDYLSYLSFGNIQQGSWVYNVHCISVWVVVVIVQANIYWTMERYLERRIDWLEKLPVNRSTTIMIEGVPDEYQTDDRLQAFFSKLFGASKVKRAYLAKRARNLQFQVKKRDNTKKALEVAKFKWEKAGKDPDKKPKSFMGVDLIDMYSSELAESEAQIKIERAEAQKALHIPGGINGCNGFVTFSDAATAEIAASMQYGRDSEFWVASVPPPAESIVWKDLERDPGRATVWKAIGFILIACLYMVYLPSVIWITKIANLVNLGPFQSYWSALAPTMGLQVMVSFLPTFLILIFRHCFTLNDDTYAQYMLQQWYFFFQLVFVILIVAIGSDVFIFMKTLVMSPLEIMPILSNNLPLSTHYYMNYVVLSWTAHATNLTRYIPLSKFMFFKRIFPLEDARKMSEPEDQDYYGLGSRFARFTTFMCIGIVFGTMSPPITLLTFVNFFVCRLVYGWMTPFAEEKKPDLGGLHFVRACRHLFIGNIVYILAMTGILYDRAPSGIPASISFVALFYVIWSMQRFETEFLYEKLPFEEQMREGVDNKHIGEGPAYIQPEWIEGS